MHRSTFLLLVLMALLVSCHPQKPDYVPTITFPATDSLQVTADLYAPHPDSVLGSPPFLILCHQAFYSRGEYVETAPVFNEYGLLCMAIDQRSGRSSNGVRNETNRTARDTGFETGYIDAIPDILGAIEYVEQNYPSSRIILVGSSYSASLVLHIGGEYPHRVDGIVAFSPGEYFERYGVGDNFVRTSAAKITCPVFITSSQSEAEECALIYDAIPHDKKIQYIPEVSGEHGSKALWEYLETLSYEPAPYWEELMPFLVEQYPSTIEPRHRDMFGLSYDYEQ